MSIDTPELRSAISILLSVPPEALKQDMVLAERVRAARALFAALNASPPDPARIEALADRFLSVCNAPSTEGRA